MRFLIKKPLAPLVDRDKKRQPTTVNPLMIFLVYIKLFIDILLRNQFPYLTV